MKDFTFEEGNQTKGILKLTSGEEVPGMIEVKKFIDQAMICVKPENKAHYDIFPIHMVERITIPV